uniref:Probable U2 small nuclear ribonucleoprotein A' n=1 Tax=Steinernema glaseri TaxID=37863 RepID=A0A1I7Z800_9BILA
MVRISHDLVEESYQFINSVNMREISLRNQQIPAIENLGATRDFFDTIDLSDNNIRKLENLPVLKRLSMLLLHNNRIQQIDSDVGSALPNLKTLALTNNNLCELGDVDALANCTKLEYLTLIGNPLTHKAHYRLYVINKIPQVRVLDFKRVKLAEREAAKKLFKGKKGQKLRTDLGQRTVVLTETDEVVAAVRKVRPEDRIRIQEAIKNAKSLQEVEELQAMLQSGKVPEPGWKPRGAGGEGEPMQH